MFITSGINFLVVTTADVCIASANTFYLCNLSPKFYLISTQCEFAENALCRRKAVLKVELFAI